MTKDEALKLALEALEMCEVPWTGTLDHNLTEAITAIKQARALDKKAENARELGLDYEPVSIDANMRNVLHRALKRSGKVIPPPAQPASVQEPEPACWQGEDGCPNRQACCDAQHCLYTTPPAAPVQEPVAVIGSGFQLLYCREDWAKGLKIGDTLCLCTPPAAQRQWVSLTDEDYHTNMFSITSLGACDIATIKSIAKDVEAKLKAVNGFHSTEKNNG
jgi:hypothetical protein